MVAAAAFAGNKALLLITIPINIKYLAYIINILPI